MTEVRVLSGVRRLSRIRGYRTREGVESDFEGFESERMLRGAIYYDGVVIGVEGVKRVGHALGRI